MTEKQIGQRLALIVTNYEYQDDTLQQLIAPAQDADALARVLDDAAIGGFDQVEVLTNHLSHEVRREIASFFARRKRNDLLLLYFSGHGVKDDDGRLYLATIDTERNLLRATAVPAAFINETMTDSRSRCQVLILDCCHSGAFAQGMVAKGGESVGVRDRFEGRGRVVLTASTSTQYAFQGDRIIGEGSCSVFTHHLVQGLESGKADLDDDGKVSLDELYDYVYERVTDETPQQTPGKWTFDLQGEIFIARNPHRAVKPVELPPELKQAIESPFAGVRAGAVDELGRLLRGSDPGLALAARAALTRLVNDDSRRVSAAAAKILRTHHARDEQVKIEAERAAREKVEQKRLVREKAERELQARLAQLYEQAKAALQGKRWKDARQHCVDINTLEPGYRDVDWLAKKAEAGLHQEQEAQLSEGKGKKWYSFGTRKVVFAALGAALYGVLFFATNMLALPEVGNIALRPAVCIPMFFGIVFGPWVGFISGFLGNIIGDALFGSGFWIWWAIGFGLMGMIPGFAAAMVTSYRDTKSLIITDVFVIIGVVLGMGFSPLIYVLFFRLDFATAFGDFFVPAALTGIVNGVILVPILLVAYSAIVTRTGR